MSVLEIILLSIGGLLFVVSFLIPERKEQVPEEAKALVKKEIEALVAQEMNHIKGHVEDVVNEAVEYSVEKTERSLERLSNEKIMAVNEYSDTVLQEIHRNHEEVMFLYDMLNHKHVNLKNTVTEVNKTVKEVAETTKEAEAVVSTFQKLTPQNLHANGMEANTAEGNKTQAYKPEGGKAEEAETDDRRDIGFKQSAEGMEHKTAGKSAAMDISFISDGNKEGQNYNERILELHRQGRSKIAIAKELGLGVGEVKLVIDLYRNF